MMHDAPRSGRGHRLRLLSLIVGDRSPEFLVFALMFGLLAAGALLLFAATEEPWLLVAVPVLDPRYCRLGASAPPDLNHSV